MTPTEYYTKILSVATVARGTIDSSLFHAIVLPAVDALIETIKLHEPVPCAPRSNIMECEGCDPGYRAEYNPDSPCSTLDTIAQKLGVER